MSNTDSVKTGNYRNESMSVDTDKVVDRCMKGLSPFVRTFGKEDRIRLIEFLESKGFLCLEDNGHSRSDTVESKLPLTIDLNRKTISRMGNVTCAAAAASQKIIINSALFYELYEEWENHETEREAVNLISRSGSLMDAYYKDYNLHCHDREWFDNAERVLPYMVHEKDRKKREEFRAFLEAEGFKLLTWNPDFAGVLVNMEFRNFGLIYLPCKHACVNDRNYTIQEFMDEVYNRP